MGRNNNHETRDEPVLAHREEQGTSRQQKEGNDLLSMEIRRGLKSVNLKKRLYPHYDEVLRTTRDVEIRLTKANERTKEQQFVTSKAWADREIQRSIFDAKRKTLTEQYWRLN